VLSIPAKAIDYDRARDMEPELGAPTRPATAAGYGVLFKSRPLVIFGLCAMLFHFANAPLLPLVGQKLAAAYPKEATAMMSACIVAAQAIMLSSSMRRRSALTGHSTDETDIGSSFHDEGNSMLKASPCLAQDSMENALPCPQWQSREAGSRLGAEVT
jgi:hypothetical protein